MPKIIHVWYCDDFEADGFFTEEGEIICAWSNNDAMWRSEYMDSLINKLGFEIEHKYYTDAPELVLKLKEWFGEI